MDEEKTRAWLAAYLAEELHLPVGQLDLDKPFIDMGLDSAALVGMIGDIEDFLGRDLDPTLAYDHPTVRKFAAAVSKSRTERE